MSDFINNDYSNGIQENTQGPSEQALKFAKIAPDFAKKLRTLFILLIGTVVGSILGSDLFSEFVPVLYYLGEIISIICGLGYGFILLTMRTLHDDYTTAGKYYFISQALSVVTLLLALFASDVNVIFALFLLILAVITIVFDVLCIRTEFLTHSELFSKADPKLSHEWSDFWKYLLYAYIGWIVADFIPFIGFFVAFICNIIIIAFGFLRLVLLRRSVKVLEAYDPNSYKD